MDQSRRKFLKGMTASPLAGLAGCIVIEEEKDPHKHGREDRSEDYERPERSPEPSDDYGPDVTDDDEPAEELEPGNGVDIDEELEENTSERPLGSSGCQSGYLETRISMSTGETVHFEEPGSIEGGQYSRQGRLTNEGDRVRIEYGPSVLYLDHEGEEDYFTFGEEGLSEWGYGDHKGRYFSLHSNGGEAEVVTGLVYDALGPDRREAIGVCIDR